MRITLALTNRIAGLRIVQFDPLRVGPGMPSSDWSVAASHGCQVASEPRPSPFMQSVIFTRMRRM